MYVRSQQAVVFNLAVDPAIDQVDRYQQAVLEVFPALAEKVHEQTVQLLVDALMETMRMDIDLYVRHCSLGRSDDEHVVAIEYLDDHPDLLHDADPRLLETAAIAALLLEEERRDTPRSESAPVGGRPRVRPLSGWQRARVADGAGWGPRS